MRGFSIPEATIALLLMIVGALLVTEALDGSRGAALADVSKTRAVRESDQLLRQLTLELAQTTTSIDASLPAGEEQRCWILADGVRFQKVEGYDLDTFGGAAQRWSSPITYRWSEESGRVTRTVEGLPGALVAHGITEFAVSTSLDGPLSVTVVSRSGAGNRGSAAVHRRTVRISPRNALR